MKQQSLSINIQSFVDVITNSSSELFICNTEKSVELIESILRDMLAKNDPSLNYNDCFGSIAIVNGTGQTGNYFIDDLPLTKEDALLERVRSIISSQCEKELEERDKAKWNQKNWNERSEILTKATDARLLEYQREEKLSKVTGEASKLPDWWYTGKSPDRYSYNEGLKWREQYEGRVIISSQSDNSIPYELFEEIESLFNADRMHMG